MFEKTITHLYTWTLNPFSGGVLIDHREDKKISGVFNPKKMRALETKWYQKHTKYKLTSFLHKCKDFVEKLLASGLVVNFVQLNKKKVNLLLYKAIMSMIDQRTLLCYGNCITLIKHPTLEPPVSAKKGQIKERTTRTHTFMRKKGLWKKAEID